MELKQRKESSKGFFELYDGETRTGFIEYLEEGEDTLVITHTEVSPDYEGQGLGSKLVTGVAEYAIKNNLKIRALCPYAKKVLSRSDDYKTLLV